MNHVLHYLRYKQIYLLDIDRSSKTVSEKERRKRLHARRKSRLSLGFEIIPGRSGCEREGSFSAAFTTHTQGENAARLCSRPSHPDVHF